MKVAVIGSRGQLGSALVSEFRGRGWTVMPLTGETHNVTTPGLQLPHDTEVVVNCAAYHRLEQCERMPLKAFDVNALGAMNVAKPAQHLGALNVYISTDYVLDPNNVYAISKLAGEELTRQYSGKYLIVRFGSLFGGVPVGKGPSFVDQIVEKALAGKPIEVVSDTLVSPAYTKDVAKILCEWVERSHPGVWGYYSNDIINLSNQGICSYFEFALEIVKQIGSQTHVYPVHNTRPHQPRNVAPGRTLGFRTWQEALREYLGEKGYA